MEQVWDELKKLLERDLSKTAVNVWFSECSIAQIDDGHITLAVPDDFRKRVVSQRFTPQISQALKELFCTDFDVAVITEKETVQADIPDENAADPGHADMTFQNFFQGDSNRLACSAAMKLCTGGGKSLCNPLFIYGNSGLGKTHLLYAIMNEVRRNGSCREVFYYTGEDFTNRMVNSLQERKMNEFRSSMRNADILCIDDVEFIAGKPTTQEEFFNTFNEIYKRGGVIVITSDRPPKELATLEERLRTRFEGGIIAEVRNPDTRMREDYLRCRCEAFGAPLPESEIRYIAENLKANFRQLNGAVKSICALKDLTGTVSRIDIDRILGNICMPGVPQLSADRIVKETARYFSVPEADIRGASRDRKSSNARQTAMFLCRSMLSMTFHDIGAEFGNRNHATVLSAVNHSESQQLTERVYAEAVQNIKLNLQMV